MDRRARAAGPRTTLFGASQPEIAQRLRNLVIGLAPRIASDSPSKPLLRSNDYFDSADRFESISLPTGPIPRPRTPAGAPYAQKVMRRKFDLDQISSVD